MFIPRHEAVNHQSDISASFVALNNRAPSYAAPCPVTVETSEIFQVRSVNSSYLHSYDSTSNHLLKELVFLQCTQNRIVLWLMVYWKGLKSI